MGKKSRGKRERKAGGDGARPKANRPDPLSVRLAEAAANDDPAGLLQVAAITGPAWLLTKAPTQIPFPLALALARAPRCLAALIGAAASEAGEAMGEDPMSAEGAALIKGFAEAVQSLSFIAAAFESDNLPHPADPIRAALGSLFDHFQPDDRDLFRARLHTLVQDDWDFVAREHLADEETADLLRAIGDAGIPKAGEPQPEKEPGGL